jgi:hypothetical protein
MFKSVSFMLISQLLLLMSNVSGAGLKHMRAHGKDDHPTKHSSTPENSPRFSSIRPIHQLPNMTIEGVHVDGLPIFVKFHKTGSGTASTIFRKHCHYTMKLPGLDGMFPWKGGPICGPLPHEHATINVTYTNTSYTYITYIDSF